MRWWIVVVVWSAEALMPGWSPADRRPRRVVSATATRRNVMIGSGLALTSGLAVPDNADAETPSVGTSAAAGAKGAVFRSLVRLATYPLDTWKTREQLGAEASSSSSSSTTAFAGAPYAVVGALPAGAVLVGTFDALRGLGVPRSVASVAASLPPLALKTPLERFKQQAQVECASSFGFQGGKAHALREVGFNAIQLATYDATHGPSWARGAAAAGLAAVVTHPMDVVKTRTAMGEDQTNPLAMTRDLWLHEGPGVFRLGLAQRVLHSALGGAVFFAAGAADDPSSRGGGGPPPP